RVQGRGEQRRNARSAARDSLRRGPTNRGEAIDSSPNAACPRSAVEPFLAPLSSTVLRRFCPLFRLVLPTGQLPVSPRPLPSALLERICRVNTAPRRPAAHCVVHGGQAAVVLARRRRRASNSACGSSRTPPASLRRWA